MKHTTFIFIIVLALGFNAYSVISLNDHEKVFPEPEQSEIGNLVIGGASDFLSSYSDALKLFSDYEVSTNKAFNAVNAHSYAYSAMEKINAARKKYQDALGICNRLNYVKSNHDKLVNFDYNSVIESKNLNSIIAARAVTFLKEGNVIGTYQKNLDNLDEIVSILQLIIDELKVDTKPDVSIFWDLLHKYQSALMFGNYSTILANYAFNGS